MPTSERPGWNARQSSESAGLASGATNLEFGPIATIKLSNIGLSGGMGSSNKLVCDPGSAWWLKLLETPSRQGGTVHGCPPRENNLAVVAR